jgi:cytosine/adenosine deaminase-related metal-dependent hydrolase
MMTDSQAAVRLLRNATVLPMNNRDPLIGYDVEIADGVIKRIGKNLKPAPGTAIENLHGDYLLPGFIHAHVHLCQTLFRHEAEGRTLVPWLRERILPFEAAHNPDSIRVSATLGIGELLLSGATALLDMGTVQHTDHIAETIYEQGIRATFGKAMMDRPTPELDALHESTAQSIDASMGLARQWHETDGGRMRYGFAPRWVLSCTAGLQEEIARIAKEHDYLIHTHAAENIDECKAVEEQYGERNIHALNTLGLASDRSVFAHCIHLDQSERDVLASSGTTVAHCPSANMQLGSGICDVPTLLKNGINVAIGADGAPCNNALDGFREMLLAHHLQSLKHHPNALTPGEILEMMTMGGARALRIDDRVGSVEVGKDADLIRLERRDFRLGYGSDPFTQIVLCGSRDLLKTLWVRGEALVEDGTLTRINGSELHAHAVDERRALLDRVS